jgi:hypothetical protein
LLNRRTVIHSDRAFAGMDGEAQMGGREGSAPTIAV